MERGTKMIFLKLFAVFLKISMFSFGGAYAFLPMLEKEIVENNAWLTPKEFLDVLGIVEVFPGAISIKYATYAGYKVGGIIGAIAANLGNLLPPVIIVLFVSNLYFKYRENEWVKAMFHIVNISVLAMVAAVFFKLAAKANMANAAGIGVFVLSAGLFYFTKIHPGFIILASAAFGIMLKLMKVV